jgi:hypothetical protein
MQKYFGNTVTKNAQNFYRFLIFTGEASATGAVDGVHCFLPGCEYNPVDRYRSVVPSNGDFDRSCCRKHYRNYHIFV